MRNSYISETKLMGMASREIGRTPSLAVAHARPRERRVSAVSAELNPHNQTRSGNSGTLEGLSSEIIVEVKANPLEPRLAGTKQQTPRAG